MGSQDLWKLKLTSGQDILVPPTGAGALIYYQGVSEPETAGFVSRFLKPGMIFFDLGAHIGEYTLIASDRVNHRGQVHSFESNPDVNSILVQNVHLNRCDNVFLNAVALTDRQGDVEFNLEAEPSVSSLHYSSNLSPNRLIKVACTTLDHYWREHNEGPDLVKIDIEGAELLALRGARRILTDNSPVIVLEYLPENAEHFNYTYAELADFLDGLGYVLLELVDDGAARKIEGVPSRANLIATKDVMWLSHQL
jgi:FkbM family methyltransferase